MATVTKEKSVRQSSPSIAVDVPIPFDAAKITALVGYKAVETTAVNAFRLAVSKANPVIINTAHEFLTVLFNVCHLWRAFRVASRYRIEDRANPDAAGRIAGDKASVTALLGMGRNVIYRHLREAGLTPDDFSGLESVPELVQRGTRLRELRDVLQSFIDEQEGQAVDKPATKRQDNKKKSNSNERQTRKAASKRTPSK